MKTTIDIAEPLLRRAKQLAARRGTTLKMIVEESLRETLDRGGRPTESSLQLHTFRGNGLQPGLQWGDWDAMRSLAYEEHGG